MPGGIVGEIAAAAVDAEDKRRLVKGKVAVFVGVVPNRDQNLVRDAVGRHDPQGEFVETRHVDMERDICRNLGVGQSPLGELWPFVFFCRAEC